LKKIFSISLSLIILLQSLGFNFNDLAQIDEFIEHAKFHNEQYGDSLFVFISKHYGELKKDHEEKHQDEKKEHNKLPFQNQAPSTIIAFTLDIHLLEFKTLDLMDFNTSNFYYLDTFSTTHSEKILQPPRLS